MPASLTRGGRVPLAGFRTTLYDTRMRITASAWAARADAPITNKSTTERLMYCDGINRLLFFGLLQIDQDQDQPVSALQRLHRLTDDRAVRAVAVGRFHRVPGQVGRRQKIARLDGSRGGIALYIHAPRKRHWWGILVAGQIAEYSTCGEILRAADDSRDTAVVRAARQTQFAGIVRIDGCDHSRFDFLAGGKLLGEVRAGDFEHVDTRHTAVGGDQVDAAAGDFIPE